MKKIVFALVVLMFAVPASATVEITAVQEVVPEPNVVIGYVSSGDEVRCFGLDIQLDNDETIIAVECLSSDYYLNPQKFTYDGGNPSYGDTPCLCDSDSGLLEGLDTNGITIAMCSLYSTPPQNDPDHNDPPAASGDLLRITVSGPTCITITENGKLGGLLDVNNVDIDPVLPDPCCPDIPPDECMKDTHPDYATWQSLGEPNCWCYARQCKGDADGLQAFGLFWVYTGDLNVFKTAYAQQTLPAGGECADYAHDIAFGLFRVYTTDLTILKNNYAQQGITECDNTDFNFWLTP